MFFNRETFDKAVKDLNDILSVANTYEEEYYKKQAIVNSLNRVLEAKDAELNILRTYITDYTVPVERNIVSKLLDNLRLITISQEEADIIIETVKSRIKR